MPELSDMYRWPTAKAVRAQRRYYNSYGNYGALRFKNFNAGCGFLDEDHSRICTHPAHALAGGNDRPCECSFCPCVVEDFDKDDEDIDWSEGDQPVIALRHVPAPLTAHQRTVLKAVEARAAVPSMYDWFQSIAFDVPDSARRSRVLSQLVSKYLVARRPVEGSLDSCGVRYEYRCVTGRGRTVRSLWGY